MYKCVTGLVWCRVMWWVCVHGMSGDGWVGGRVSVCLVWFSVVCGGIVYMVCAGVEGWMCKCVSGLVWFDVVWWGCVHDM